MKIALVGCLSVVVASLLTVACGTDDSNDPSSSNTAEKLGGESASIDGTPDKPSTSNAVPQPSTSGAPEPSTSGGPAPSTSGAPSTAAAVCPPGERLCTLTRDNGTCYEGCIPAGAMCADHTCPTPSPSASGAVCDPAGPKPNAGCTWDLKTCEWSCPVCDPAGPRPKPGCSWDSKHCVWLCL